MFWFVRGAFWVLPWFLAIFMAWQALKTQTLFERTVFAFFAVWTAFWQSFHWISVRAASKVLKEMQQGGISETRQLGENEAPSSGEVVGWDLRAIWGTKYVVFLVVPVLVFIALMILGSPQWQARLLGR